MPLRQRRAPKPLSWTAVTSELSRQRVGGIFADSVADHVLQRRLRRQGDFKFAPPFPRPAPLTRAIGWPGRGPGLRHHDNNCGAPGLPERRGLIGLASADGRSTSMRLPAWVCLVKTVYGPDNVPAQLSTTAPDRTPTRPGLISTSSGKRDGAYDFRVYAAGLATRATRPAPYLSMPMGNCRSRERRAAGDIGVLVPSVFRSVCMCERPQLFALLYTAS
jgi:hypothetical protein